MATGKFERLREIFAEARRMPAPERLAYLDKACGEDASLRAEVEGLLSADRGETVAANIPAIPTSMPARIGSYEIVAVLGEGGMGLVYKGQQRHPIHRLAAIKVVKPGFNTQSVIARFESERQALATMDHPHIARVYEAGVTDLGQPFFAMEFVEGEPITVFADKHQLSIRQRLRLFMQVCAAVDHAHRKLVIHRDLKPTNVLAYMQDGQPAAKVIDFGIAKALSADATASANAPHTLAGGVVGTYEYMSPEQAAGSADIDTRTDVYSLGVLLYELLTGARPLDAQFLKQAAEQEIRRVIQEVEAPRPSTRLSSLGDSAVALVESRQTELRSLVRQLRSELEWIPLMALRKERDRRYASPLQLAQDIQNYLENRPLIAGPESKSYRLRKFVAKRKVPVLAGAAAVLALVLGVIGTSIGLVGQREARLVADQRAREAEAARAAEAAAKDDAVQQRDDAQRQKVVSESTLKFLTSTLWQADPDLSGGRDMTVREAMDAAVGRAAQDKETPLTVRAAVLGTLGAVYSNLGRTRDGLKLLEESLRIKQRELGVRDEDIPFYEYLNLATCLTELYRLDESLARCRQALAACEYRHPGDHRETVQTLNQLGDCLRLLRRGDEAISVSQRALDMSNRLFRGDNVYIASSMRELSHCLMDAGRVDEALAMNQRLYPFDHSELQISFVDVANVLYAQERYAEALPLFRQAYEMGKRLYRGDHPRVSGSLAGAADCTMRTGQPEKALPMFREAAAMERRRMPGDGDELARTLSGMGKCLAALGQPAEAAASSAEASAMWQRLGRRTGAPSSVPSSMASTSPSDTAEVYMSLVTAGAQRRLGFYHPQRVQLSSTRPAAVKSGPTLVSPRFGTIRFAGGTYLVAVDEPDGGDASLCVDANGNGDLTDDDATIWDKRIVNGPGGRQLTQYDGGFRLPLKTADGVKMVAFRAYRFDKDDPQHPNQREVLLYYSDYGMGGHVVLGGAKYDAILMDDASCGDFRGQPGSALPGAPSTTCLWLDLKGDGRFDPRFEVFDVNKPFNVRGTTWEIADLAADGTFRIVKSSRTVPERPAPPDHSVGRRITPFKGITMAGKPVDFPADYKGKLVLLDFWATWCGPCMEDLPVLVKNYGEYHDKGVEMLGISLDQDAAAERIQKVMTDKGMTWAQVYDGKGWKAAVAQKYWIDSIPATYLVDGDTGQVLASGEDLRGDHLAPTLRAALKKKFPGQE